MTVRLGQSPRRGRAGSKSDAVADLGGATSDRDTGAPDKVAHAWRRNAGNRPLRTAALFVGVALICRFVLYDRVEFKYDEAQVATLALALARRHVLPETSILTSGGFANPPIMVYLTAIPLVFATSPLWITAFFTVLNALSVGALYILARRCAGAVAAIVAAALYAVNPLAIHYARKIWAPDAMPPFTVLLLAGLILGLGEGSGWSLAVALLALGVLVQLHQAAITLLPVTALLFVVFAPRLAWRRADRLGVLVGLAGGALLLLPYALYERGHQWADVRGVFGQATGHATITGAPWRDLWWLVAGWNPAIFFQDQAAQERISLAGSGLGDWLTLLLLTAGAAVCALWLLRPDLAAPTADQPAKGRGRVVGATLLLVTLAPPLLIMRTAAPIFPHYVVFLQPALFLLVGIGASAVGRLLRRGAAPAWLPAAAPGIAAVALVAVALARDVTFDRQLLVHHAGGDYGTPVGDTLAAARALAGPGDGRAFIMASDGDTAAVYRYLVAAGLVADATVIPPDQALLLPDSGGRYLFRGADMPAFGVARDIPGAMVRSVPSIVGAPYTLVVTPPGPPTAQWRLPGGQAVGPFNLGSGLQLTASSVTLTTANGSLQVALAWTISDPAPFVAQQPIRMFIHLYDGARRTLAQADALGAPPSSWRRGDQLLTWFTATPSAGPLAPGQYALVAGVYAVTGFRVFPVTGPQGQALGGEIPLGVVTVR